MEAHIEKPSSTLSPSVLLGTCLVVCGIAALIALLAPVLFRHAASDLRVERGWTATPVDTRQTRAAQAERLAHYAWLDREHGVVALPVERAMELTLRELRPPAKPGGEEQK